MMQHNLGYLVVKQQFDDEANRFFYFSIWASSSFAVRRTTQCMKVTVRLQRSQICRHNLGYIQHHQTSSSVLQPIKEILRVLARTWLSDRGTNARS